MYPSINQLISLKRWWIYNVWLFIAMSFSDSQMEGYIRWWIYNVWLPWVISLFLITRWRGTSDNESLTYDYLEWYHYFLLPDGGVLQETWERLTAARHLGRRDHLWIRGGRERRMGALGQPGQFPPPAAVCHTLMQLLHMMIWSR